MWIWRCVSTWESSLCSCRNLGLSGITSTDLQRARRVRAVEEPQRGGSGGRGQERGCPWGAAAQGCGRQGRGARGGGGCGSWGPAQPRQALCGSPWFSSRCPGWCRLTGVSGVSDDAGAPGREALSREDSPGPGLNSRRKAMLRGVSRGVKPGARPGSPQTGNQKGKSRAGTTLTAV